MEASSPPGGYEFTPEENEVMGATARWVGYLAWISIVGGVLMVLVSLADLPASIGNIVLGAADVFIGFYFRSASGSFKSVVTTEGSDISHLMSAIENLGSAFKVIVILTAFAIAAVVVAAISLGEAF